ncbi:hypothetical protein [Polaromonas sp. CG_23.6]|uniref:hypothetical protein n=1 Tax=Polaromonas sp. CG_23.6 TaxID=2760709 RepID=UPI002474216A|nr:hypothetical protein [Polaromonas sp. CG_23.6]MDH6186902.1 hypothetical protein [Polaromonas sp. CG_23.6]
MTKLNHNRPLLRYLDNIRREIAVEASKADNLFRDTRASIPIAEGNIFPLNAIESAVFSRFFSAIKNHLDIEFTLIAAGIKGASRQSKLAAKQANPEAAEVQLKAAALAFSAQMFLSTLNGRMNLLNLYKTLEEEIKNSDFFLWKMINDVAMKDAMQEIAALVDKHTHGMPSKA